MTPTNDAAGAILHHRRPLESRRHLVEITIISAQDLYPATRAMHMYASVWVQPDKKFFTLVDTAGRCNPSWNEKFIFEVDDNFIRSNTSMVTVNLHAMPNCINPGKVDQVLGTVGIIVSSFQAAPGTRRFVALQVRRPTSLRPQGMLNVSIAIIESCGRSNGMFSYDLYTTPAFSFKDFIGGKGAETKLSFDASIEFLDCKVDKEKDELKSKLEMWKVEMSPNAGKGAKKRRRWCSCFCGGNVKE